jgi:hypothetical protein
MGVDHAEARRLAAQIGEHAAEHGVFEDIGKTAGVKGVAIVQVDRE